MSPLPSPATGRRRRAVALVAAIAIALLVVPSAGPSPSDAASAAAATPAAPAAAPGPHDFTQPIFSANARGDLITIGNVTTTCDPTYENDRWSAQESADACAGATGGATGLVRYDGAPMPPINNRFSMVPVDVDGDRSTFSSSTARLALPAGAVVLWAGLHWNAATVVPTADQLYGSSDQQAPPDAARRFSVRLRTPATTGYAALDAAPADGTTRDTWDDTNPGGTVRLHLSAVRPHCLDVRGGMTASGFSPGVVVPTSRERQNASRTAQPAVGRCFLPARSVITPAQRSCGWRWWRSLSWGWAWVIGSCWWGWECHPMTAGSWG